MGVSPSLRQLRKGAPQGAPLLCASGGAGPVRPWPAPAQPVARRPAIPLALLPRVASPLYRKSSGSRFPGQRRLRPRPTRAGAHSPAWKTIGAAPARWARMPAHPGRAMRGPRPWWPRRPLATLGRKPRQGRKAATVSIDAGAEASRRGRRLFVRRKAGPVIHGQLPVGSRIGGPWRRPGPSRGRGSAGLRASIDAGAGAGRRASAFPVFLQDAGRRCPVRPSPHPPLRAPRAGP